MLSKVQQQKFQKHLLSWFDLTNSSATDEFDHAGRFEEIAPIIETLYLDLGYERPQIISCSGPTEQIILPGLVGLMLHLGAEASSEVQFERGSGLETSAIRAEWQHLWRKAYSSIDWNLAKEFDVARETLLNSRIDGRVNQTLKNTLAARIDQELGIDEHQQYEIICKRMLEFPCERIRSSLSYNLTECSSLWRSFVTRLHPNLRKHFKIPDARSSALQYPLSRVDLSLWMGRWDWCWLATADYISASDAKILPASVESQLRVWKKLAIDCNSYLFSEHCCFVFLRPREAFFDEGWRLHHSEKAAVDFVDGTRFFYWHGIEVDDEIILNPKKIKLKAIEQERNIERRRVMIERYGIDNYTLLAKKIQEDECGILYHKQMDRDEDLLVVKVVNSTPEPDGTFKNYFLRVPPGTRTARQGVAWTFGLAEDEYQPVEET